MPGSAITVEAAWRASVHVTSIAFGLNATVLGAKRRWDGGKRGPVTPEAYWEARKIAICVAVLVADCGYAQLARAIGMHKDTVASTCDGLRQRQAEDPMLERRVEVLEARARQYVVRELLSLFDDFERALVRNWELEGRTIPPEEAMRIATIKTRMAETATSWGGVPPGVRHAHLINFPRASEVAE